MKVDFKIVPPIGTVLMLDAQRYELVSVEPYTRKDGGKSQLLTWVAQCPDCGGDFVERTGLRRNDLSRRCPEHRTPFKRVKGGRGRTVAVRVIQPEGGL